jgi:hypothetical protein
MGEGWSPKGDVWTRSYRSVALAVCDLRRKDVALQEGYAASAPVSVKGLPRP